MRIVVLAGGYDQIALIQSFKDLEHYVILVDYNKDPVARIYADKHYPVSTLDIEKVKEIAIDENANLVVTACTDQALIVAAQVSQDLGLYFPITHDLAKSVTNKKWMKQVFVDNNIPTARYVFLTENCDYFAKTKYLRYPIVCKPADANSSKGVSKLNSKNELQSAYQSAISKSRTRTVIIEEFTEGTELSIDVWVNPSGKATVIMVSKSIKNHSETGNFPIGASFYPACDSDYIDKSIYPLAQRIANSFNLKNTPLLIQVIANGQNISVLELSARIGGGCKHQMIKYVTGIDTISLLVQTFLGFSVELPKFSRATDYFLMKYLYAESGTYSRITGSNKLKQKEKIVDFFNTRAKNSVIEGRSTSSDRVGALLIKSSTKQGIIEKLDSCFKSLAVISSDNKNILITDDISSEI